MPEDIWEDVIEPYGEEVRSDDTPFSPDDLPGWGNDGYYPGPWPPEDVLDWFPEDLIDNYGGEVQPNPDGVQLFLPSEAADQIAEELRARGHQVEKTCVGDLPDWLSFVYV